MAHRQGKAAVTKMPDYMTAVCSLKWHRLGEEESISNRASCVSTSGGLGPKPRFTQRLHGQKGQRWETVFQLHASQPTAGCCEPVWPPPGTRAPGPTGCRRQLPGGGLPAGQQSRRPGRGPHWTGSQLPAHGTNKGLTGIPKGVDASDGGQWGLR